jgi:hypothetical protein
MYRLIDRLLLDNLALTYHLPFSPSLKRLIKYSKFEIHQLINYSITTDDIRIFSHYCWKFDISTLHRTQLLDNFFYNATQICDYCIENNMFFNLKESLFELLMMGHTQYCDILTNKFLSEFCDPTNTSLFLELYCVCKNVLVASIVFKNLPSSLSVSENTLHRLIFDNKWDILEFILTNHKNIYLDVYILQTIMRKQLDVDYIIKLTSLLVNHRYKIIPEHLSYAIENFEKNTLLFLTLTYHLVPYDNNKIDLVPPLGSHRTRILHFLKDNNDCFADEAKNILLEKGYIKPSDMFNIDTTDSGIRDKYFPRNKVLRFN